MLGVKRIVQKKLMSAFQGVTWTQVALGGFSNNFSIGKTGVKSVFENPCESMFTRG